ncbi:MAG: hypothetical protein AABZ61_11225, partial [Bacteroidota bacterium]
MRTTLQPQYYSYTDASVNPVLLSYGLKQVDLDWTIHYTDPIHIDMQVDAKQLAPKEFAVSQNYPNPFNPS